jgi:N-acetyl-gamma-glutamyl-phosphate reductase
MVKAAIVGAAGYTGAELTRLLAGHPHFQLQAVTSSADAGRRVSDLYPALTGVDLVFTEPNAEALAASIDVAFLAVPHTAAMALAPTLLKAGVAVIDLSADFRLREAAIFESWYGVAHAAPELLSDAVYGLPELWRDRLLGARLVACPGCYPTATVLAAAPALAARLTTGGTVIADAKSGVSGAGRTPGAGTHYCTVNEAVAPYKVGTHRHTPEIAQALQDIVGAPVRVMFTPTLVPMTRGLLSTVYLEAAEGVTAERVWTAYAEHYRGEPFVTVHPLGVMPSTAEVRGGNRVHIGVALDAAAGVIVAVAAIDNLVKGASGQAVQCANIAFGLEETAGLAAFGPVV